VWDGLKEYVTNTRLTDAAVMENYKNLRHIEKAFRMSITDLRIRPKEKELKLIFILLLQLIAVIRNFSILS
jgi:hypothetical protein